MQININHAHPIRLVILMRGLAIAANARDVNGDIDAAEPLHSLHHAVLHGSRVAHVQLQGLDLDVRVLRLDGAGDGVERVGVAVC
jgi:hypothetical protein